MVQSRSDQQTIKTSPVSIPFVTGYWFWRLNVTFYKLLFNGFSLLPQNFQCFTHC